jgi:PBP1b-binding outer membrane lipoprotein LpoB
MTVKSAEMVADMNNNANCKFQFAKIKIKLNTKTALERID